MSKISSYFIYGRPSLPWSFHNCNSGYSILAENHRQALEYYLPSGKGDTEFLVSGKDINGAYCIFYFKIENKPSILAA